MGEFLIAVARNPAQFRLCIPTQPVGKLDVGQREGRMAVFDIRDGGGTGRRGLPDRLSGLGQQFIQQRAAVL
ncbi:hypothetical protein LZ189_22755, partial [Rhodovulum sulfidophilum]|nr:hypothetical protein [Rhodovulum sulfidophilum]